MLRESLERLSQQERCIAGLEARLAEATMARNEEQVTMAKNQEANIVKQEEGRPSDFEENNNSRGMIAQMAEKLAKKKRSKEDEIGGEERSRRGSSSSREFRVEEEMEEEEEEMERNAKGGRRGSSSSREFQHEGEVGDKTNTNIKTKSDTNQIQRQIQTCISRWGQAGRKPPLSQCSPTPALTSEVQAGGLYIRIFI